MSNRLTPLLFGVLASAGATAPEALAESDPPSLTVVLPGGLAASFLWVSPGSFIQGAATNDGEADPDESPRREVTLTEGFYLCQTEVTQAQWTEVMGENPSTFQQPDSEHGERVLDRPVESVTWRECDEFTRKLSGQLPGSFRLPSEAEWEYACRAGTTTRYSHGDAWEWWESLPYAWLNSKSRATTHPVGTRQPNPWGFHDLHGNVWEWTSDWYGPYEPGPVANPTGPPTGNQKVFRGGSWYDQAPSHRSSNRHRHPVDRRYSAVGLRLVYKPEP